MKALGHRHARRVRAIFLRGLSASAIFGLACCSEPATPASEAEEGERKDTIIVSGFEPFGGRAVNGSWVIAQLIEKNRGDFDVEAVQIPVLWGAPGKAVEEMRARKARLWLAFGEGKNGAFWIETVADNRRGSSPDNNGRRPEEPLIIEDAAAQLQSEFPADTLAARLREKGFPCRVSQDAGHYLCEEMAFQLLHEEQQVNGSPLQTGLFIHIPLMGTPLKLPDGSTVLFDEAFMEAFSKIILAELTAVAAPAESE